MANTSTQPRWRAYSLNRMKPTFDNASEDTKRLNPHIFPGHKQEQIDKRILALTKEQEPDFKTTDERKLNKTEAAYLDYLKSRDDNEWIGVQNITLKLADDCRYTCDFSVVGANGRLIMLEVKGFFRDDAKVKIKVAARLFPWIQFIVVQKTKGVGWTHTEVKP